MAVARDRLALHRAGRSGSGGGPRCRAGRGHARSGRAVRPAPRRGGSIGPDWPPARRGAASVSISRPGRVHPAAPPVFRGRRALDRCAGTRPGHQPRPRRAGRRAATAGLLLTIDGDPPRTFPPPRAPRRSGATPRGAPRVRTDFLSAPSDRLDRDTGFGTPARNTSPRRQPENLADGLAAGRRSGRRRAAGHAIAALDARWVFLADKAVAGQEERLRRFAAVLRALPAWPAVPLNAQADPNSKPFGVAVRRMSDDAQTFLEIANDSPYPIRLAGVLDAPGSAPVEDLGRGLRLSPVAGGGRSQPGSRPAPLRRRGDPGRGAARSALRGDALSVRSRADDHAVAIQRAVGPTGASQSRPGRDPCRTGESGFRARSGLAAVTVETVARPSTSKSNTRP